MPSSISRFAGTMAGKALRLLGLLLLGILLIPIAGADGFSAPLKGGSPEAIQPWRTGSLSRAARALSSIKEDPSAVFTILHIGDSHVQYGEFTGAARALLQEAYGDAGRGFVFPYALTGTDGPTDTRFSAAARWEHSTIIDSARTVAPGMSGYGLALAGRGDSLDFSFIRRSTGRSSSLVRLFTRADPSWKLSLGDRDDPSNFAALMDSSAFSSTFEFRSPARSLRIDILPGDTPRGSLFLDGLSLESGRGGVLYHSIGVNSATFNSFSAPGVLEGMARLDPDLVVISLGTNESANQSLSAARMEGQACGLIDRVRSLMPRADILLTGPGANASRRGLGGSWKPNRTVSLVNEGIRRAAAGRGAAYWNWLEAMGGEDAMESWVSRGLAARDGVHLSPSGYAVQGKAFGRILIELLEAADA